MWSQPEQKEDKKMKLLIVSGLSGAGKSVAMNALEDIGFFCIDNIPSALLPSITAFSKAGDNQLKRVALCMDVRGCRTPEEIEHALDQMDEQGVEYEILFLDAPDEVLMRRYSETRRRHPISIAEGLSTREAFRKERAILQPLQGAGRLYHQYRRCSPPPRTKSGSATCSTRTAGPRTPCA